ncbi:MAG: glycosyltransferase family 4 protein [Candidatus Portnoybacteria bacterium]|nr:glycosyltransferase family 4 protein [Candidatus Portnoybacteria bacterium]
MLEPRKKVLFLITQSVSGGAQKYVFDLAKNLPASEYEVAVAAGGNGELLSRLETAGVPCFRLKRLVRPISPFCDILAYFEIKNLLKKWRPDVLHLNSSKAGVLGSLAAKNLPIKVIYTVHGAVFEAAFSWLSKKLFLWLEKWTAKYKHKIICVSENDKQLWLKYNVAPEEKLVAIHNGINLNIDFLTKEEARRKLFEKTSSAPPFIKSGVGGISTAEEKELFLVGTIAYFYPEKNLDLLIDAAALIFGAPKLKDKKILFLFIGSGQQENNLKLKIKNLKLGNKVLLIGSIPKAHEYLKALDVFVLPSLKEGLPYTILEAMAAGIPIIASNIGGIPEMISDNHNGFLISPDDAETLAERILQVLENKELTQRFSQNSLEKVKNFSLEAMVEKTKKQY